MANIRNLKEFARLAGVSTATISRALTGSGRVSEETRQRISALADKLGYQPNVTARNLRMQRTNTIGVLVPLGHDALQHLSDPFFNAMTGFLADELSERGYDLLLSRILPTNDRWLDNHIGTGRTDGTVVIGQSDQTHVIEAVARRYLPMVVWGGYSVGQHHCSVGSDNRRGGAMAAAHLVDKGCQTIAFVGPTTGPEFGERLEGVRTLLGERGRVHDLIEIPTHWDAAAAYDDFLDLLPSQPRKPDGIVAGSDVIAISLMRALNKLGCSVPRDVKIVGYDGLPIGEQVIPPLTTVDQQLRYGAKRMIELLFQRMAGVSASSERIEPRLIIRQSA